MSDPILIALIAASTAVSTPLLLLVAQYFANRKITTKIDAVHILVNSNLMESKRGQLHATRLMLTATREMISMKQDRGIPIAATTYDILKLGDQTVRELSIEILHMQDQTDIAAARSHRHDVDPR